MSNVKSALQEAGIRSEAQLETMSTDDLRNAKVPIAARLYLGTDRVAGWSEEHEVKDANFQMLGAFGSLQFSCREGGTLVVNRDRDREHLNKIHKKK